MPAAPISYQNKNLVFCPRPNLTKTKTLFFAPRPPTRINSLNLNF
jgi:hypothetical protein